MAAPGLTWYSVHEVKNSSFVADDLDHSVAASSATTFRPDVSGQYF
jgi:hypothetical protein